MFGIKRKSYSYDDSMRKGIISDKYKPMEKQLLWSHTLDPNQKANSYPCNTGLIVQEK